MSPFLHSRQKTRQDQAEQVTCPSTVDPPAHCHESSSTSFRDLIMLPIHVSREQERFLLLFSSSCSTAAFSAAPSNPKVQLTTFVDRLKNKTF